MGLSLLGTILVSVILLIAVAFVVVVWALANRNRGTLVREARGNAESPTPR